MPLQAGLQHALPEQPRHGAPSCAVVAWINVCTVCTFSGELLLSYTVSACPCDINAFPGFESHRVDWVYKTPDPLSLLSRMELEILWNLLLVTLDAKWSCSLFSDCVETSACLAVPLLLLEGAPICQQCRGAPQTSCSWLQVRSEAALKVRCGRIVSALLPAAELLLRGVMDLRHKYWQQASPTAITVRDAVEQARRTRTRDPQCVREPYSKDCRQMCSTYPQRRSVLLGSLRCMPCHARLQQAKGPAQRASSRERLVRRTWSWVWTRCAWSRRRETGGLRSHSSAPCASG